MAGPSASRTASRSDLSKPQKKTLELEAEMAFPAEHMRRIIEAALEGKSLLELPVYDGSETGEKVYNTLTVIGREVPAERQAADRCVGQNTGAGGTRRWPVTISYFDKSSSGGEQTPVYAIGFELFENGISRALSLDYGDFVISGEMSQLDVKEASALQVGAAVQSTRLQTSALSRPRRRRIFSRRRSIACSAAAVRRPR